MHVDDVDPNTLRGTADALEAWLPQLKLSMEASGITVLSPDDVLDIIQGGVIDRMRDQAFDIGMSQAGILDD